MAPLDRRSFLGTLALGTLATAPGVAAAQRRDAPWRFQLDAALRWSLVGPGGTVLGGATIALQCAGHPLATLADLTDVRRFRTGSRGEGTWNVIGRLGPLEVTALFEDGPPPRITVRARGLDAPRDLVAIRFTEGVTTLLRTAFLNGYQSWSPCGVIALSDATDATSHWQLGLWGAPAGRAARSAPAGLALVFGETDGGAGEFRLTGRALRATARFERRTLAAEATPTSATLTLLPDAAPLEALGRHAAERAPQLSGPSPAGWCSWYEMYTEVSEEKVLANLEVLRREFGPSLLRFVQIDDGFQRAAGDWEGNDKFPHGHRWLTDRIREAGFTAGLWLAPLAVAAASPVAREHPDWLLLGSDGLPLTVRDQASWGGRCHALDGSLRPVQDWLRALARRAVTEWGYDYLKLDFLYYGALGTRPERQQSPTEALRAGLRALREGAGRAFVLGCGAPLQHSLGLVDGMRIGEDVEGSWDGAQVGARAALLRAHLHRRAWHNDPDVLLARAPLTLEEARAWASVVALSGGMTLLSDDLPRLPADRLAILRRTLPAADVRGLVPGLAPDRATLAPGLVAGDALVVSLGTTAWRFHAGDDVWWSDPDHPDTDWPTIEVGTSWERAGQTGVDGFAWYRVRFAAPVTAPSGPLWLELGRVDDVDETFLNGVRLGGSGDLPPAYRPEWQTYRRYAVPSELVRWGAENVVAVRVYDGGGAGGLWSFRLDRPPVWTVARAQRDWWTVAAVNWEDEERPVRARLADLGVQGPLAVYDVWAERRQPDVTTALSLTVPRRSAIVLGLRRPRRSPFVLGTTRHVVQGALDVADERWDARRKVLSGRATMLDGRPYAITIAVPAGLHPRRCGAEVACSVVHPHHDGRAARLEFERTGESVEWEVGF
jgi:hypothetical protein